jgi:hypothetical protein
MVGGRRKGRSSREEKEEAKGKSLSLGKDPCPPFYMPRGAGYMSRERVRESELLHAKQVCGRITFSMRQVLVLLLVA